MEEINKFLRYIEATKTSNTYRTYLHALKRLFPNGVEEITEDFALSFIERQKGLRVSDTTIKHALVVLIQYMKYFGEHNQKVSDICRSFRTIEKVQPSPTMKEIENILDGIHNQKYRAIFAFAAFCGLRVSEIAALRFDDYAGNHIVIRSPKNKREASIFISQRVMAEVEKYLLERMDTAPTLFTSRSGKMGVSTIQQYITERMEAAGYPQYHMHSLRRFFCNCLVANGINLAIVQRAMRHKSIQSTQKYMNINGGLVEAAVNSCF